jgi:hypothetical protein
VLGWLELWSFAKYSLRLTGGEFFALTPRQFRHLSQRHRLEREHAEFMFAQITSWIANTGFRSPKNAVMPRDFMPSMFGQHNEKKPVKLKRRKRQVIATEIRDVMANWLKGNSG